MLTKVLPFILSLLFVPNVWAASSTSYDGTNDKVVYGNFDALEGIANISYMAWVNNDAITSDNAIIQDWKFSGGLQGWLVQGDVSTSSGRARTYNCLAWDSTGTLATVQGATDAVVPGTWQCVACTFEGGSSTGFRLYIDGVEDANSPVDISSRANVGTANNLQLGELSDGSNDMGGDIAYAQAWSRTLSADEVYEACYHPGSIVDSLEFFDPGWNGAATHVDLVTGATGTVTGATDSADGPPVFLTGGPQ